MDTAPNQDQNLSSHQIKQKLLDLFDLNENIEQSRSEINQWNELLLIEQNISLRNQIIANIQSQQSSFMQESLQNERNEIQKQTQYFKQAKLNIIKKTEKLLDDLIANLYSKKARIYQAICFYDEIPISFEEDANLIKVYNSQGVCEYRVQGCKDIFSIQRIPINPQKKYKLEIEIKNCSNQTSFIGYKSYNQNYPIYDRQSIVFQRTEVLLIGLDMENKAFIVNNIDNNLSRWNNPNAEYYEKYIGFYKSGNINEFIKAEEVIIYNEDLKTAYREIDVLNNKIYLNDWAWTYYMNTLHSQTYLNQTILMNHGGGGTYNYCEEIKTHHSDWTKKFYDLSTFRKFTDTIEICILANYQGIQSKVFEFRNVNFFVCEDDNE
ncbi:hypothetical protein TTHERM_00467240 (macronuclear) [Tetrahymena thermophila SB210]|uniref:Uncharacterized protein n=1 Tax=Tetrahymena thermophila (strain SB210) TaxID=312017 RepID=I7MAK5_TETTS|nr:hypothetical protein TTHERM_00467240 [Tetrahymena thermophila SB210]EAS04775.1 hypothetical protein TTHERM_00467240 [Tetrahymena thermophila SB210]|eukprot:XP_001025020.1 hypothetical protein TTHERM_00467240 [Tetrahymena thermophila SB210]